MMCNDCECDCECDCVQALMRALYQVSDAMAYLVSRNVVHRDLALRLVNADVE